MNHDDYIQEDRMRRRHEFYGCLYHSAITRLERLCSMLQLDRDELKAVNWSTHERILAGASPREIYHSVLSDIDNVLHPESWRGDSDAFSKRRTLTVLKLWEHQNFQSPL